MNNLGSGRLDSIEAGAPADEIELTPAMIEAGADDALAGFRGRVDALRLFGWPLFGRDGLSGNGRSGIPRSRQSRQ